MALKRTILANNVGFRHVNIWSLHDFPVTKYNVILVAEISLNSERDIRPEQTRNRFLYSFKYTNTLNKIAPPPKKK